MSDILSLPDARKAIGLPGTDTTSDDDLTATYIPAVTITVEDMIGPQSAQTGISWTADGGNHSVLLPTSVTAVTEVVESGQTLDVGDYVVDLDAGIVSRGTALSPMAFQPGYQNVVVTYNAGTTARANVVLAARIILAHLWTADDQGDRPDWAGPEDEIVSTPSGYAIPRRAARLLTPSDDVPGFA